MTDICSLFDAIDRDAPHLYRLSVIEHLVLSKRITLEQLVTGKVNAGERVKDAQDAKIQAIVVARAHAYLKASLKSYNDFQHGFPEKLAALVQEEGPALWFREKNELWPVLLRFMDRCYLIRALLDLARQELKTTIRSVDRLGALVDAINPVHNRHLQHKYMIDLFSSCMSWATEAKEAKLAATCARKLLDVIENRVWASMAVDKRKDKWDPIVVELDAKQEEQQVHERKSRDDFKDKCTWSEAWADHCGKKRDELKSKMRWRAGDYLARVPTMAELKLWHDWQWNEAYGKRSDPRMYCLPIAIADIKDVHERLISCGFKDLAVDLSEKLLLSSDNISADAKRALAHVGIFSTKSKTPVQIGCLLDLYRLTPFVRTDPMSTGDALAEMNHGHREYYQRHLAKCCMCYCICSQHQWSKCDTAVWKLGIPWG